MHHNNHRVKGDFKGVKNSDRKKYDFDQFFYLAINQIVIDVRIDR